MVSRVDDLDCGNFAEEGGEGAADVFGLGGGSGFGKVEGVLLLPGDFVDFAVGFLNVGCEGGGGDAEGVGKAVFVGELVAGDSEFVVVEGSAAGVPAEGFGSVAHELQELVVVEDDDVAVGFSADDVVVGVGEADEDGVEAKDDACGGSFALHFVLCFLYFVFSIFVFSDIFFF